MEEIRKSIADELLRMAEADQAMRNRAIDDESAWDISVDKANQKRLKEIVDQSGWPTISSVGVEGAHAAWLIAQHSPDIAFMEHCLDLIKSLPEGEASPKDRAYLIDRVLMMNGKQQIYGTQFRGMGDELRLWPVEDAESVDQRRAELGMEPVAEYEVGLRKYYKL